MTHIWVPKVKILEAEFAFPTNEVEGWYTITRRKEDTEKIVQQVGPFKNLITNIGLNRVGTAAMTHTAVGVGTTPPSESSSSMESLVAYTNTNQLSEPIVAAEWGVRPYSSHALTRRFAAGTATGNLTEVGIGWLDIVDNVTIFRAGSRALIVDGNGDPTSITVLSDEILDVTYELRNYMYPWADSGDDISTSLVLSGVTYGVTMRPLDANTTNGLYVSSTGVQKNPEITVHSGTAAGTPPTLAAVTASNMNNPGAGANTFALPSAPVAYSNNSLTRESIYTAGTNQGNLTYGIRGFRIQSGATLGAVRFAAHTWQAEISPAIPKDNTKILSFGSSYSWSRK